MIEVLVHAAAPLLRRELAEEWMGTASAFRFSTFVELPHAKSEPLLFDREVPVVRDHEFWVGGTAAREWLLIGVDRLHQRTDQPADENTRRVEAPGGHIE